jgi:hypothetical protein
METMDLKYVTLSEWRGKLRWDCQDDLARGEVVAEVTAEIKWAKNWIRRLEEARDRLLAGDGEQMRFAPAKGAAKRKGKK